MPLAKVVFRPGINKETTSYGSEQGWFDSSLIRFRKGRPEKMGGWQKLSSNAIQGTPRSMHIWSALDGTKYMGMGTESKIYVEEGGDYNDITPIRSTVTLSSNPFKTGSAGSGTVTVTHASHGANTGDFVTYTGATTTDGITAAQLNLEFEITVVNSDSYTISTAGSATSGSTAGGGTPTAAYQINAGLVTAVAGTGWGAGLWGGLTSGYSQTTLDGSISDSETSSIDLTSAASFETAATTLSGALTVSSTIVTLADSTGMPSKGTILVDSEKIIYGTNAGNVLGDITRAADGTTVAAHSDGATATFVGLILIDNELIQYTGKSSNDLNAGIVRGVRGTTAAAHSDDVVVCEANDFVGWGQSASISSSDGQQLRLWFQDNWGEDLAFNVFDGTPYYWDKTLGLSNRATTFASQTGASAAPTITRQIMVSGADRHIICFGCNPRGETAQDLLHVRWSDQESPFDWTPTATNTAGSQRISSGSEIIRAQKTRQEILIWTDVNLHTMRFVGPPLTFSFTLVGSGVSLISPNALTAVGDRVFWMSRENFHAYSGRVETIPCTVLRYVFDDMNIGQSRKFFAASNKMFDEVIWFYVSSDATEIDRYAKFNYVEGTWDIGALSRTAWTDFGVHDFPRGAGSVDGTQYVYIQENGSNADGSAMTSYIESADFDLDPDGDKFMFLSRLIPDIDITTSSSSSVNYVLKTRNYPGESLSTNSTNEVSSTTTQSFLRARARQAAIRIESSTTDIAWTLGDLRLEIKPDGRR